MYHYGLGKGPFVAIDNIHRVQCYIGTLQYSGATVRFCDNMTKKWVRVQVQRARTYLSASKSYFCGD